MPNGAELRSDGPTSLGTTDSQEWDISQLIITAAQRAIGMIDINCDRIEVPFDPEVTKQLASIEASIRDSEFRTAAKMFTDRDEGWHSVALSDDGKTLVLDRTGDPSTLVPFLNTKSTSQGSQFHIFHSAVDRINNEELVERAIAAINREISESREEVFHGVKFVTFSDKSLTRKLVRISDATFIQIAKRLIEESSGREGVKPYHTVALSKDGTIVVLFRVEDKSSALSSLGKNLKFRVFHDGK